MSDDILHEFLQQQLHNQRAKENHKEFLKNPDDPRFGFMKELADTVSYEMNAISVNTDKQK